MILLYACVSNYESLETQQCVDVWRARFHIVENVPFDRLSAYLKFDPAECFRNIRRTKKKLRLNGAMESMRTSFSFGLGKGTSSLAWEKFVGVAIHFLKSWRGQDARAGGSSLFWREISRFRRKSGDGENVEDLVAVGTGWCKPFSAKIPC